MPMLSKWIKLLNNSGPSYGDIAAENHLHKKVKSVFKL